MDVAAVFQHLLELPAFRDHAEKAAGGSLSKRTHARLGVVVFLHDIGKLHPGFQAKGWPEGLWDKPVQGHVTESWAFLERAWRYPQHPFHKLTTGVSQWGEGISSLLRASLSHHGRPLKPGVMNGDWPVLPHYDWRKETGVIVGAVCRWFPDAFADDAEPVPHDSAFGHFFAGLAALADWVGSDRRFFEFVPEFDPQYDRTSRDRAAKALIEIGLDVRGLPRRPSLSFAELTNFAQPNPAQEVVGMLKPDERLVILEAETGSGKTEAALWRFAQLFSAGCVEGLYFAVPTRAAARQLHGRVNEAMRRVFGTHAPEAVLAIPGMLTAGAAHGQRLPDWKVLWEDRKDTVPARWAAEHATRFLAATVAVGTVDQAMLAGLEVKHAHLRGSSLSRSLLVIDEVHASDSYMTAILRHLLNAHLAVGGYAMLMSATLGSRARLRWTGETQPGFDAAVDTPYPAVWTGGKTAPRDVDGTGRSKAVQLRLDDMAPQRTAALALEAAEQGARVLVIRNTVTTAVETWRAAQEAGGGAKLLQVEGGPALHHSRFAAEDRRLLDAAVEEALSPDRNRTPKGVVVIGTQTLEQSLDIDADFLITDLCPVDVLLQRIGRLHRHDLPRPDNFQAAQTVVMTPEGSLDRLTEPSFENGLGGWEEKSGGFQGIYRDVAGLELTRRLIDGEPSWRIPEMNRRLVEGATHPERIAALIEEKGEKWQTYDMKLGGTEAAERSLGDLRRLDRGRPYDEAMFPDLDERILTRLGEGGAVLTLDPPSLGPFGREITQVTLPARWSAGISSEEAKRVEVHPTQEGVTLKVGDRSYGYSRSGVERVRC